MESAMQKLVGYQAQDKDRPEAIVRGPGDASGIENDDG